MCPVCLRVLDWERAPLVTLGQDGSVTALELPQDESEQGRRLRLHTAYRTCHGTDPVHYLPADYGDQDVNRITVGVIGRTSAGKTHLLAAMIGQFMRGVRLRDLALQVAPLDIGIHKRYVDNVVTPFLDRREQLDLTAIGPTDIADAFLVTNLETGRRYSVTFFDVSGELLARAGVDEKRFLGAVNALIFVIDPEAIRGLPVQVNGAAAAAGTGRSGSEGDPAFDAVLRLLRVARDEQAAAFLGIPAAVVVGKSDLLRRGDRYVDWWLRAEADEDLDLDTVEEESGDVFTYLYTHGGERWLEPAQQCIQSTLHFASAAGTAPRDGHFPDVGFRPRRVIKPLLALLAMKGVIDPSALKGVPA